MEPKTSTKKLAEVADIFTGVRLSRYEKENTKPQKALVHKSITQDNPTIEPKIVQVNNQIDPKYYTKENDIVYKLQGTPFGRRITTETGLIVSHSFAIIRTKPGYNPTYIENFLNYPIVQNELKIISNESLIAHMNMKTLNNLTITTPSTEEQNKYGEIVNLIDQRIKANTALIANDQEMKISLISKLIGDNHE